MRPHKIMLFLIAALLLSFLPDARGEEAYLMRFPDIYKDKIVFVYSGDLWIASTGGGYARQLTSSKGIELLPKFSPDGKWVAFTGMYNGYSQVYVVPSDGGIPKQLTFYPSARMGDNSVVDWTVDGKYVVFKSMRNSSRVRPGRFYRVSLKGGWPQPLPFEEGATGSFSPDGKKIAFNRVDRNFRTWKRYKGGMAQDVWIYDFVKDSIQRVTDWVGTDRHPMWHGDKIYFISDKTGVLNLYCYNTKDGKIRQVTDNKDWDIRWPGFGPDAMVFELRGKLYKMNFANEKIAPLKVSIAYDKSNLRSTYINASRNVEAGSLAPGAKRAVITARGEIFTIPAGKGNIRNLTNTAGIRERSSEWSPDGKWIAYLSDETGTEELYLFDQYGKKRSQLTKDSKFMIFDPRWSPDSGKIAYFSTDQGLYYIDIKTKEITCVEKVEKGLPGDFDWSPDSKWIAYSKSDENNFDSIFLYNLERKKSYRVTDDSTVDRNPVFDVDGKYLFFVSSRNLMPTLGNLERSYTYGQMDRVHFVTLQKDAPSLFAPESDEVEVKSAKGKKPPKKGKNDKKSKDIKIDLHKIGERIMVLPVQPSNVFGLSVAKGVIFYVKLGNPFANLFGPPRGLSLFAFDLKKKKELKILSGMRFYSLSADRKKILWATMTNYGIAPAIAAPINLKKSKRVTSLKLETLKDPMAEWKQMFLEAWRLEKNFFYVKNMHGIDWDAIRNKYLKLVPHLAHRYDLTYLIGEMISELCTSHTYVGGGDMPRVPATGIGLLGAELQPDAKGYFRIVKIYKGENWSGRGRSPLTEPGVKAAEGDYILAVNGKPLRAPANPYQLLEKTRNTTVTLKLSKNSSAKKSWEVKVRPIASETWLRYLDSVERMRAYVARKTGGKVGYVHIPDMMFDGLNQFAKQYYGQLNKQGIIIDARYNGGGFVSQMILERLRRVVMGMRKSRLFDTGTYPSAAFSGHLVALTNKYAGSDGDIFPHYFQKYKLGPVIGTRTWGGVVGINGFTPLLDGGFVTMPTAGSFSVEGKWVMENHGIDPDIVIDNLPQDAAKGKDDQLDKAIAVILKKIKEKPVKLPVKPKDPVKTQKTMAEPSK